jgi:hypothetical protein
MSLINWLFPRKKAAPKDPTPQIVEKGPREPIHWFEAPVVGVELENQDDTVRQEIIARADVGAETLLVAQMGALKLAAVFIAATGEQIGYLSREVSIKIIREAKGYDYGSRIAEIHEPDPDSGIRNVTLTIEVFEKPGKGKRR